MMDDLQELLDSVQEYPDRDPTVHLTECYKAMYPDDPDVFCTCYDESPEWTL